ncbi:MAG: hypothetical protein H8E35_07285 [Ardenticatenia bacterium]|nr:hypothetical protein [Ardenticatenia bacterium]
MLRKPSTVFNRLLDRIGEMPVFGCHEHLTVPEKDLAVTSREPLRSSLALWPTWSSILG